MNRKILISSLVVVLVSVAFPAVAAGARVTDEQLRRAVEDLDRARSEAGFAGAELAAARSEAARLRSRLEGLTDQVAAAEVAFAGARQEARGRARALYVSVGVGNSATGEIGPEAVVRQAYASAVASRDREVVNGLAAAAADRDRLRSSLREAAGEQARLARRLEDLATEAGRTLAEAEAEYARVRTAWEVQEAERRAAAAAAAAAQTSTTTSPTTTVPAVITTTTAATTTTGTGPATTTTLPDPVDGGLFPPLVERWRPLVAAYFPANLVDEALAVIRCESFGDPSLVNPSSGASGLFQHMPRYWPARAAAVGFPGASPLEAEPNVAAAAWLVRVSLEDGLPAWYFWSCKP
jgi:peptidoglycan hydrolase CwlO-like protein